MNVFSDNAVTVVRKRCGKCVWEEISTTPVLPGEGLSFVANRSNVIKRLRRDPSVVFVLDDQDGRCAEKAFLGDGLEMSIFIEEGEEPSAYLAVSYQGDEIYRECFCAARSEEDEGCELLRDVLGSAIRILTDIADKDFSFLPEDSPFFSDSEPGEPVGMDEAHRLLEAAGYQTETVCTVGDAAAPILFVHENDVVMLGSWHFSGERLFLEMKRLFLGLDRSKVRSVISASKESGGDVEVFEWEDGSWAFRLFMDEYTDEVGFLDELTRCLGEICSFIDAVETQKGIGPEPLLIMQSQRHLFIHEAISQSVRLMGMRI